MPGHGESDEADAPRLTHLSNRVAATGESKENSTPKTESFTHRTVARSIKVDTRWCGNRKLIAISSPGASTASLNILAPATERSHTTPRPPRLTVAHFFNPTKA